jgi:hypothetical protein
MFSWFGSKLLVDDDEFDWILASAKWFTSEFDGAERLAQTPLVGSDARHFPPSRMTGHARAVELFAQVRRLADMADWPCDLLAVDGERPVDVAPGHALRHLGTPAPAGTFEAKDGRYLITYDRALVSRPRDLIAVFAHELAHYLMASATTAPPGGAALEEHATDLCAIFLGFGAFSVNAAASFEQFQTAGEQGWQMRRLGYMSELGLLTAYAVFVRMTNAESSAAAAELKPYLRSSFRKTLNAIDKRTSNLQAVVEAIDLAEWK